MLLHATIFRKRLIVKVAADEQQVVLRLLARRENQIERFRVTPRIAVGLTEILEAPVPRKFHGISTA